MATRLPALVGMVPSVTVELVTEALAEADADGSMEIVANVELS